MITLRTLGDVCLIKGTTSVQLPKKCSALLAFLCAAPGRSVTRTEATLLLWDSGNDRAARHSLNQALYTLRRNLGPSAISTTESSVCLATQVRADFLELPHALDSRDAERIGRLAKGRFFEGIPFDDAPEFATWRDQRSTFLERKLCSWFESEFDAAFADAAFDHAERIAVEGLSRFPWAANLHLGYVKALLMQHGLSAAREAYSAIQRNSNELDIAQMPCWEEVAAGCEQPIQLSNSKYNQDFVGRDAEMSTIRKRWRQAQAGTGSALLIRGKPGMGKTYLCEECTHMLSPGRLFHATAYEGEQRIGFSLLGALLRNRVTQEDLAALTPVMRFTLQYIVPDIAFDPPINEWHRLGQEAGEWRIFEAATRLLVAISRVRPALVIIDNVQWADDASRAWIDHLSRQIAGERILLLATSRTNVDTAPSITYHAEITLDSFDERDVRAILARHTCKRLDPQTVADVMRMTGGHPLFTTALALRLKSDLPVELPEINARIVQLPLEARRIVDLLAVLARPLHVDDLVSLCGVELSALAVCVRSMSDLCAIRADGLIELVHDLIRAAVYDRLPEAARRHYHAQAASYLELRPETSGLAAQHWFEAGNLAKTTQLALQAAAESESKHAAGAAYHFYKLAIRTEEPSKRQQIKIRLAEVLFQSAQYEMAIESLGELVRENGDDLVSLEWQWRLLFARVATRSGEVDSLIQEARELEMTAERCGHGEALFHAIRAQVMIQSWLLVDHTLARHKERLVALSNQYARSRLGTSVLRFVAELIAISEDAEKGLSYAQTACDWAKRIGEVELVVVCLRTLASAQYFSGRIADARATLNTALEIIERTGAILYRGPIASKLVCVLTEMDAADEVVAHLEHTMATRLWDNSEYLVAMANNAVMQFNDSAFADAIETCNKIRERGPGRSWLEMSVRGLRGLCLVQLGAVREALQEAETLRVLLDTKAVIAGDISYAIMLISRVAVLQRKEAQVETLVREKVAQYASRDFVCRLRLQLALADVLTRTSLQEAIGLVESVLWEARDRGLAAVTEQAMATLRRIRRKGPTRWMQSRISVEYRQPDAIDIVVPRGE